MDRVTRVLRARADFALQRTLNPHWMTAPHMWMWQTKEFGAGAHQQGFGRSWRENVGMANLLWLTMEMDLPPDVYDARENSLYCQVLTRGRTVPGLFDLAELCTLDQFCERSLLLVARTQDPLAGRCRSLARLAQGRLNARAR